jgi:hypothetical protein
MPEAVYHFTDTMALPWIISSGELRPGAKRYYTPTRLLWATTCDKGEKTATCGVADEELECVEEECVNVGILLVRFKLAGDDFLSGQKLHRAVRDGRRNMLRSLKTGQETMTIMS